MSFDLIIVLCTRYHNIISDDIRFYKNVNALIMYVRMLDGYFFNRTLFTKVIK